MKKLLPIFILFSFALSACGLPGSTAKPTAVSVPTAIPETITTNPTLAAQSGKTGSERTSAGDGMVQVFVPGGKFQMGGFDGDAQKDEHPAHAVTLSPFWIDKLEVTNGMFQLCVQAGACQPPRELKSESRANYYANKEFADYPVIYVSWKDATNYCQWAGRRLPTEAEWEYAARGNADYRRFPWGDQSPDNSLANYDYQSRDTSRVGSFPKGASPFGALDMAGNVWEWVADYFNAEYYNQTGEQNPTGPNGKDGGQKGIRGGSWADGFKEIRVSNRGFAQSPDLTADSKSAAYLGDANSRTGFRCAADGK
ncbi:MAG: SUMF1/EgtB/PvdO family nonheme iron enzyme [Chloroflexi bacterium]|nr:SUMF1/EgtB/PvdO family nonheme iron enzyme [Chloroflexota bacterium]